MGYYCTKCGKLYVGNIFCEHESNAPTVTKARIERQSLQAGDRVLQVRGKDEIFIEVMGNGDLIIRGKRVLVDKELALRLWRAQTGESLEAN